MKTPRPINFRVRFAGRFFYTGDLNTIDTFELNLKNSTGLHAVWQQSSDIADKRGLVIYEGDIVKYSIGTVEHFYLVKFGQYDLDENSGCGWYIEMITDKKYWPTAMTNKANLYLEVVGNEYDNPELMIPKIQSLKTIIT